MPRTQTTGVEVVIRARALAAQTALRDLRKDVTDFTGFATGAFSGLSRQKIAAPKLGSDWRKLERDLDKLSQDIKKHVDAITANGARLGSAPTVLRVPAPRATPASRTGTTAAGGVPSRAAETEEAARLTREYRAGILTLDQYQNKLQQVAQTGAAGSEKQIDAFTRLRGAERQVTAETDRRTAVTKKAADAAEAAAKKEIALQEKLIEQEKKRKEAASEKRVTRFNAGADLTRRAGDALTVGVTAPIVGTFAGVIKETTAYEGALRNVNSIAKLTEAQFQSLYQRVILLAKDPSVRQGPTQLAEGLYEIESSGFHGQKGLDVLAVSAKGASAGLTDTATSSHALIAVLNSNVSGVTSAAQAMDVLFKTVDVGTLNFSQLANNIGKVLPTAAQAGVSIQELGAAFAAMTNQGISAETSATGLLNLMNKIANPSKEAEKNFRAMGISYGYTGLQAKGLTGVLQEISAKTHGNAEEIKKLLPEARAQRALFALITNDAKRYTEYLGAMGHANEGLGATQAALNEQNKSYRAQLELLRKDFQVLAVQVGPAFIKALRDILTGVRPLIDRVKELAETFSKLPPEQQQVMIKMFAVAASVGPVISGLGRLGSAGYDTIRLFQLLKPATAEAAVVMEKELAPAVTAVTAGASSAGAKVGWLTGLLGGLAKVGKIGVTVAIAVLGAEALGQVIRYLDKLAGGGLASWLADTAEAMGADKETVGKIRKEGVPTLFQTAGMVGDAISTKLDANRKNAEAENAPLAVARRDEQEARGRRQTAYQKSAQYAGLTRSATWTYDQAQTVREEFRARGQELPRGLNGQTDWYTAAKMAAAWQAADANREGRAIQGARARQTMAVRQLRQDAGNEQFGGGLNRLVPNPGVNLRNLDKRTSNVIRAASGTRAGAKIVSVTRDKQGRQVVVLEGNSNNDIDTIQEGLVNYGIGRARAGETPAAIASTLQARRQGNRLTVTVTPDGVVTPAATGKKTGGPPVQPPPRETGGSARVGRAIVPKTDAINAEATVAELTDNYDVAFSKYGERGERMSAADRKQAQQGLLALANRIQASEEKVAAAKLQEANDAAAIQRVEAEKLRSTAKNQNEIDRADELVATANKTEAEASARNVGELASIRRNHSERYRAILKTQENVQQKVSEQDAKDAELAATQEAERHEQRIAELDKQLANEQDTTKRQALLTEKYDEMGRVATSRFNAASAAARVIQDPREKARAYSMAGDEYNNATAAIKRDRSEAGLDNDKQAIENQIRLHQMQADNTDDLIAKYEKLKQVQDEGIELMRKQGVPAAIIAAQQEANERQRKDGQAEIARDNAGRLLVRASTEGVDSFAPPEARGIADLRQAGGEVFREQLRGVFKSEYDNTAQAGRGRVAAEQFDRLKQAVEVNAVAMTDILPLLRDIETRVNATGDFGASQDFYKGLKDFFKDQLSQTFTEADRLKGPAREKAYNDLIAGVQSGDRFGALSDKERSVIVTTVQERRDKKDDSDKERYHTGLEKIGDEAIDSIKKAADKDAGGIVAGLFGNREKAKKAATDFWKEVGETGSKSLARVGNELLLKPIASRLQNGLENAFKRGADGIGRSLEKTFGSFDKVFKGGIAGILQAAAYLQGVLALSGQQGRRGKKGGLIGAAVGVGLGVATGGTGLALLGAGLTGAGAGGQAANGNYLGAALAVGTGFIGGGSFGAGAFQKGAAAAKPATAGAKAIGGAVGAGGRYRINEERDWHGPEYFVPNVDGTIIPSATAISRLPTVAAANNNLLSQLTDLAGSGNLGGGGDNFTLNDYGDKHYEEDGNRTLRKFSRVVRDTMNRRK